MGFSAQTSGAPVRRAPNRQLVAACLGVGLIWLIGALQWPLRDAVVPWDSKNQFYAFFRFMAKTIHEGSTPFWNPYHYSGHPSIADPQSLIFSPIFVLWALFDPDPSLFAFDALVLAHVLVGGIALVFYGRRHDWTPAASVLAATIFMFGGVAASRLNHVGILQAYGLFPLALLWMEVALDRPSYLAGISFGAVFGLIALGRTQVPLLICLILCVAYLAGLIRLVRHREKFWPALRVATVAGLVTFALTVVPMLLTLQFADFSNRPEIEKEVALRSSLYPLNLATMFSANVFGSLDPLATGNWGPAWFTRREFDTTDRSFNYMFMGSLTALLLIWVGFVGRKIWARANSAALLIAGFGLLYAVGRYTPLFPFLYDHLPGVKMFRRPVDGVYIFIAGMALLAGKLATDYVKDGLPKRWHVSWMLALVPLAGLLASAVLFSSDQNKTVESLQALAVSGLIYAGLAALLLFPKTQKARAIALSAAVAFTGVEIIRANMAVPMNAESRAHYAMLENPTPDVQRVVDALRRDMQANARPDARPRVEFLGLSGPWQNAAMVFGIEATTGYNPLRTGPYDRLVEPGERPYSPGSRRFPESFSGYDCLLSKTLGLEYVVSDAPLERMPALKRTAVETVLNGPGIWIYRFRNALPRISFDQKVQMADAAMLIDEGLFPDRLGPSEVLVDSDDTLQQRYALLPQAPKYSGRIADWKPDRVDIEMSTSQPGILSLHDIWYPGWEVEVDGKQQPVLRTDVLFRGVEVAAGDHRIVFRYRPLSLTNLWSAAQLLWGGE
jgi:hypothetical protein